MEFFGRNWNLTIKNRVTKQNTVVLTPDNLLRFTFDITIVPDVFLNFGQIVLYNQPQSIRDSLHIRTLKGGIAKGQLVELSAGYGKNIPVVFSGAIHECYSQQQGANVLTFMDLGVQIGDVTKTLNPISAENLTSETAIANQVNNILTTLITDRTTGKSLAINDNFIKNCATALSNSGVKSLNYALSPPSGTIRNVLDYLNSKLGIKIYRDAKGSINCISEVKDKTPFIDQSTETLTIKTGQGILGNPIDYGTGVSFRTRLRPDLKIYQKINFRSKFISKTLVTQKIQLQGDTYGDGDSSPWFSDVDSTYSELLST